MTKELFIQAILKYTLGVLLVGLFIFLPAGTFDFWNGWLFMGILFVPMFFAGIVMMLKNPELLKKRLNAKDFFCHLSCISFDHCKENQK